MSVTIKTAREIELMREAGRLLEWCTMNWQKPSGLAFLPGILIIWGRN